MVGELSGGLLLPVAPVFDGRRAPVSHSIQAQRPEENGSAVARQTFFVAVETGQCFAVSTQALVADTDNVIGMWLAGIDVSGVLGVAQGFAGAILRKAAFGHQQ
jgi:hypothetical protein